MFVKKGSRLSFVDVAKDMHRKAVDTTMGNHVVFHHVPKCGGTSVARALRLKYLLSQVTIKTEASYRAWEAFSGEGDSEQMMQDVLDLREQMLLYWMFEDTRCVSAHVRFSPKAHDLFRQKYKFITILRDPVDRFISSYFWHTWHTHEHDAIHLGFEEFLETGRARRMGARYVEYYCGLDKNTDMTSESAIQAACSNLSRFDAVGRLDDLDDFEQQIKQVLGVRIKIGHENKMRQPKDEKKKIVTPELREKVKTLCLPDMKIWEHVLRSAKENAVNKD